MKKYILTLLILSLCLPLFSQFFDSTGKNQTSLGRGGTLSVAQAKRLRDDQYVSLIGNIISRDNSIFDDDLDQYIFQDETGTIKVEIDSELFLIFPQRITPEMTVKITGEIDKDFVSFQLEVNYMEIISSNAIAPSVASPAVL